MKSNRWALLMLVLAAGAVLWFWSPWETGRQPVEFENANELLAAAQEKTGEIENYSYKADISVGNDIKVSLENKIERDDPKRQMMDFSWSAPNMKGKASMYAEGETILINDPHKDKWVLPEEETALNPFIGFFWRQVNLVDPVDTLLKADVKGKNISILDNEAEQVGDTVTVQLIPGESELSELSKALPPQLIGAELKDLRQLYWISQKDLLVRRYEVRAKVSFFGLKTMEFKTVTLPKDFNNTVIEKPRQLTDKLNQIKTP